MKCELVVQPAANDSLQLLLPKTVRIAILAMDGNVVTNFQPRLMMILMTFWRAGLTPKDAELDLRRRLSIDVQVVGALYLAIKKHNLSWETIRPHSSDNTGSSTSHLSLFGSMGIVKLDDERLLLCINA